MRSSNKWRDQPVIGCLLRPPPRAPQRWRGKMTACHAGRRIMQQYSVRQGDRTQQLSDRSRRAFRGPKADDTAVPDGGSRAEKHATGQEIVTGNFTKGYDS